MLKAGTTLLTVGRHKGMWIWRKSRYLHIDVLVCCWDADLL